MAVSTAASLLILLSVIPSKSVLDTKEISFGPAWTMQKFSQMFINITTNQTCYDTHGSERITTFVPPHRISPSEKESPQPLYPSIIIPGCFLIFGALYQLLYNILYIFFYRSNPRRPGKLPTDFPLITIQLPVYNESSVVRRLLKAMMNQDWPPEKLQIHLIDDSDDETTKIAAETFRAMNHWGVQWRHIRRHNKREGYKGGSLKYGTDLVEGEFVAYFDADFVPQPDYLKKMVPHFYNSQGKINKNISFLQNVWGSMNQDQNWICGAESLRQDGYHIMNFYVRGLWCNGMGFSGTCGIFRTDAVKAAGGWHTYTVTEDLDLGYRCRLAGYESYEINTVHSDGEIPDTMRAFKTQQYRWSKGYPQVGRRLLRKILGSGRVGLPFKIDACMLVIADLCWVATLFLLIESPFISEWDGMDQHMLFLWIPIISTAGNLTVICLETHVAYPDKKSVIQRLSGIWKMLPLTLMNTGLCLLRAVAWFDGAFRDDATFERTPKKGDTSQDMDTARPDDAAGTDATKTCPPAESKQKTKIYKPVLTILELGLAIYFSLSFMFIAQNDKQFDFVKLSALLGMFHSAVAFFWTSLYTILDV